MDSAAGGAAAAHACAPPSAVGGRAEGRRPLSGAPQPGERRHFGAVPADRVGIGPTATTSRPPMRRPHSAAPCGSRPGPRPSHRAPVRALSGTAGRGSSPCGPPPGSDGDSPGGTALSLDTTLQEACHGAATPSSRAAPRLAERPGVRTTTFDFTAGRATSWRELEEVKMRIAVSASKAAYLQESRVELSQLGRREPSIHGRGAACRAGDRYPHPVHGRACNKPLRSLRGRKTAASHMLLPQKGPPFSSTAIARCLSKIDRSISAKEGSVQVQGLVADVEFLSTSSRALADLRSWTLPAELAAEAERGAATCDAALALPASPPARGAGATLATAAPGSRAARPASAPAAAPLRAAAREERLRLLPAARCSCCAALAAGWRPAVPDVVVSPVGAAKLPPDPPDAAEAELRRRPTVEVKRILRGQLDAFDDDPNLTCSTADPLLTSATADT